MPLVKIIRHGQITLPKEVRSALRLKEGDYLEVDVEGGRIVLTPKVVLDREEAVRAFHELLDRVGGRHEHLPEEEVERDVLEAIQEVRQGQGKRRGSEPTPASAKAKAKKSSSLRPRHAADKTNKKEASA